MIIRLHVDDGFKIKFETVHYTPRTKATAESKLTRGNEY